MENVYCKINLIPKFPFIFFGEFEGELNPQEGILISSKTGNVLKVKKSDPKKNYFFLTGKLISFFFFAFMGLFYASNENQLVFELPFFVTYMIATYIIYLIDFKKRELALLMFTIFITGITIYMQGYSLAFITINAFFFISSIILLYMLIELGTAKKYVYLEDIDKKFILKVKFINKKENK